MWRGAGVTAAALLTLCSIRTTYCDAADVTPSKSHFTEAQLIATFAKAAQLNDHFNSDAGRVSLDQLNQERSEIERYDEDVVDSHLDDCVRLLSSKDVPALADAFFEFLISAENSADEDPAWALGQIFFENPDLLETTFSRFKQREREILYKALAAGWLNVRDEISDHETEIKNRDDRLKRMKTAIE